MELTSLMGADAKTGAAQKQAIEYKAQMTSPLINGEVRVTVANADFTATGLSGSAQIAFAEINALSFADYTVTVKADSGNFVFSRMGEWGQRFYDVLCDAYNKAVLRSMFIKGNPILTARGDCRFNENGVSGGGAAPVHVYENCVAALPPDLTARRVPLCFTAGVDKGSFELTLRLDSGESYTYAKLGYDTDMFAQVIEGQIRKQNENTLVSIKEIDPTLSAAQATQLARLMPQGAAASVSQMSRVAPAFVTALESKIAATADAESYTVFKEMCDPSRIWVGFRKNDGAFASSDPFLLWMIAPSPNGRFAAVEFCEAGSATFVYKTGGVFDVFARRLNRALEAISFKREVIRMSDDELSRPENADYFMAVKRTAALKFIRSNFAARVIHSSVDSWKQKLAEIWGGH